MRLADVTGRPLASACTNTGIEAGRPLTLCSKGVRCPEDTSNGLGTGQSPEPSDRVEHLFRKGHVAKAARRLYVEALADALGMNPQQVIRLYGLPALPPEPKACVYLVASCVPPGDGLPVKIGYTGNLRRRLVELQAGSVDRLFLVAFLHGDRALEKEVQGRLEHLRIREDWFRMADEVRAEFAESPLERAA